MYLPCSMQNLHEEKIVILLPKKKIVQQKREYDISTLL